ncbi:MAG TPA: helicase-related protein [Terriglobia bacterium]|nr:helicase-related protein [Terriglobia bacterium]
MPTHDIIDNRSEKLVDHINRILASTEAARFAVGYFFLSGLTPIAEKLAKVKELRLLIGNTTSRETLEQLAEGYQRLDLVAEAAESQAYPKRTETQRMAAETAANFRSSLELMDQTDESEALVRNLAGMIEEKRVKVKVYTKGRLHAKAYIFDYGDVYDLFGNKLDRHENGISVIGSSNLTLSGVTHNTELNVIVPGNNNHAELVRWFDELWNESQDFDEALMQEMRQSWALAPARPYDIYMKTLYALVKDRLEGEDEDDVLWADDITRELADFQRVAVKQAGQMIKDYGGAFVADVVGLGKSYIGAAIVKHFETTDHARPLILCPAPLVEMWELYNERYELNARVLSTGFLREQNGDAKFLLKNPKYKDRDFLLIDESHNFRHPNTQRYKVAQNFLATGRRCCFLTATPRNKSAWDIYNQIKLFHQAEQTDLPVDPPNLREYFRLIEKGERRLQDLLVNILIRRTRNHILRWYGFDKETNERVDPARFYEYVDSKRRAYVIVAGKHQFFPRRELETIEYSIEDAYQGLYQQIRGFLGKARKGQPVAPPPNELTYARYGLWHYVKRSKQGEEPYTSLHRAGVNLRGLIRVLLFKRFESSVYAFKETIGRLLRMQEVFLAALEEGFVPAGEDAQAILYASDFDEQSDVLDALRELSSRYNAADFDIQRLREHIDHDNELLSEILRLVKPITPQKDAKLVTLLSRLRKPPLNKGKRLIFTEYADTARYLYDNLNPGGKRDDIDVIYSSDKSKARVVGRFSPLSNPEYVRPEGESELNTVVATDVLSEGLNLQDCDKVVNYDLHWNPVRLIQRFGRIDRIGSENDVVYAFSFLPEAGIDRQLGLRQTLQNRIQEIQDTIGEDSAILDPSERINPEAMYAIYEKNSAQLSFFEDEGEDIIDLNEAEEILRLLRKENPGEFGRISELRDGIRAARTSAEKNLYVFCQAGRYQQLFLVDDSGGVVSRDIPRILGLIKAGPEEKGLALPPYHNAAVMRVKSLFSEEVKHREAEREHTLSLTQGQKYVLRELRILFGVTSDQDEKAQINLLEKAFRGSITDAVKRELNRIRRNAVAGPPLLKSLGELYLQHRMRDWVDRPNLRIEDQPIPKVVCSEALV